MKQSGVNRRSADGRPQEIYAQMGMAALLPGMRLVLEKVQAMVDEIQADLAALQGGAPRGRPRKAIPDPPDASSQRSGGVSAYWASLTDEERIAETARRSKKRLKTMHARGINSRGQPLKKPVVKLEKVPRLHPRDPTHPNHEEWLAKVNPRNNPNWKGTRKKL